MINFENLVQAVEMFFLPNGHDSVATVTHKTFEVDGMLTLICDVKTKTKGDYKVLISKVLDEDEQNDFLNVKIDKTIEEEVFELFRSCYLTSVTEMLIVLNFGTKLYLK